MDTFSIPLILVFDIYYSSTGSIEVLTEREEVANEPSLFIGRHVFLLWSPLAFDSKVNKPADWKGKKILYQGSWPYEHGGNYHPANSERQHNFALLCMPHNTLLCIASILVINPKCGDFRDNYLAFANKIYTYACILKYLLRTTTERPFWALRVSIFLLADVEEHSATKPGSIIF